MTRGSCRSKVNPIAIAGLLTALSVSVQGQSGTKNGEWRTYGGGLGSTRDAPLHQINASNFKNLPIAWRVQNGIIGRPAGLQPQGTAPIIGGRLVTTARARRG